MVSGSETGILTFPDIRWRWEGTEVRCIRTVQRGQCRGRAQQPIFVFVNLGISYEKRFRVRRTRIDGARFLSLTADRPSIYRVGIFAIRRAYPRAVVEEIGDNESWWTRHGQLPRIWLARFAQRVTPAREEGDIDALIMLRGRPFAMPFWRPEGAQQCAVASGGQ